MILVYECEDYDGSGKWKPCFTASNMNNAEAIIARLKEKRVYCLYRCEEIINANSYVEFVAECDKIERAEALAKLTPKQRKLLGIQDADA
jgi:hypothetical protein